MFVQASRVIQDYLILMVLKISYLISIPELNNGLNSTEDLSLNLENGYASYSCGGH
jgi:hypothetical protein